jgi:hypothetical protein
MARIDNDLLRNFSSTNRGDTFSFVSESRTKLDCRLTGLNVVAKQFG